MMDMKIKICGMVLVSLIGGIVSYGSTSDDCNHTKGTERSTDIGPCVNVIEEYGASYRYSEVVTTNAACNGGFSIIHNCDDTKTESVVVIKEHFSDNECGELKSWESIDYEWTYLDQVWCWELGESKD
jgi:hypothetical protein